MAAACELHPLLQRESDETLRKIARLRPGCQPLEGVPHRIRNRAVKFRLRLVCGLMVSLVASGAGAQTAKPASPDKNPLRRHYDLAQGFQSAGKLQAAAVEYRLFVGEALQRLAVGRSNLADFAKALPMFEEALNLAPSNEEIRLDYAEACLAAGEMQKAETLAQDALDAEPRNAKAHLVMGRILSRLKDRRGALAQFEAAVDIQPDFQNGFALANEYLRAKDEPNAEKIFREMLGTYRDPAARIQVGTAYAESGYPEQAIAQFKKVLAKDPKYPGAHYALGAAYLVGASDAMYPQAAEQFLEELALRPDDFLSRYQLGFIELSQHKLKEAEADLKHAAALEPANPDSFLSLGQLYMETNRPAEAETALRKCIALTTDVARNHYQVQRAHYMLARLLLQSGHAEEGKAEMQVSQELMRRNVLQNQGRDATAADAGTDGSMAGRPAPDGPVSAKQGPVDAEQEKQVAAYEKELAPAIADSYNNLGAIAAGNNQLPAALDYFERAHAWNPSLEGLDYNWGKAAFSAYRYNEAIGPLGRYLNAHPDDQWARSALGTCLFTAGNYAEAVKTLQPLEAMANATPQLGYMYGVALIKAGDYNKGVAQLKAVEANKPEFAAAHEALGEAFTSHKDFNDAAGEFREVTKLSPGDYGAKYNLALALIQLQQNDEAQELLVELSKSWQDPHVYFTLGKLQLARGDVTGATASLEKAAQMSPKSGPIHYELAAAYRRDARIEDADREMKLYQALQNDAASAPGKGKPE
jgi:tetratricopeptide (TPR) repeat protein